MTTDLARYAEDGARQIGDYRWPIVSTAYPRWCYVTTVVVDLTLWGGVMPTPEELAVVDSFHREYMSYWYGSSLWLSDMQESHTFDVDGGANGRFLLKRDVGDWCYRKTSWQYGHTFMPPRAEEPMDLVPLLDRIHTIGDEPMWHWTDWKARHAEVFAAVTS